MAPIARAVGRNWPRRWRVRFRRSSTVENAPPKDDPTAAPTMTTPRPTEKSNAMRYPEPEPQDLAGRLLDWADRIPDRILDWAKPASVLVSAAGAVVVPLLILQPTDSLTGFTGFAVGFLFALVTYLVFFLFVGLPLVAVMGVAAVLFDIVMCVAAVLCAATQATWSALRR